MTQQTIALGEQVAELERTFATLMPELGHVIQAHLRLECLELRDKHGPTSVLTHLAEIARKNTSAWSGGPLNTANIVEAIRRQAAIELLAEWTA